MHRIKVDFAIFDFEGSPEELTSQLGVEPTRTYLKGEKVSPNAKLVRKHSCWILTSGSDSNLHLEDHLEALAAQIQPHIERFQAVCGKYYSEFRCRLHLKRVSKESIPSVHLTPSFCKLMLSLNAELDLDIYVED